MKYLIICLFFLFVSCTPDITSGKVIDKFIEPCHEERYVQMYIKSMPIYGSRTVPDRYRIAFASRVDGEVITRTVTVSEEIYCLYKVGDFISFKD
jgi:hypothetical protein